MECTTSHGNAQELTKEFLPSVIDAIKSADLESLKQSLCLGYKQDRSLFTKALLFAETSGQLDCLEILFKSDPDILERDSHGCSSLMIAAFFGRTAIVSQILTIVPSTMVTYLAEEAMPYAAQRKHFYLLKILFKYALGEVDFFRDPAGIDLIQNTIDADPLTMTRYVREHIIQEDTAFDKRQTQLFMRLVLCMFAIFDKNDNIFYAEELMSRQFNGVVDYDDFRNHVLGLKSSTVQDIYEEYKDYVVESV